MRVADLLGTEVLDREGRALGHVYDVRLVQDGPPLGAFGAALRFDALLVGPSAIGARLGFERRDVVGPWPLKRLFRAVHGRARVVEWEQVAAIEERRIRLRSSEHAPIHDPSSSPSGGRVVDAGLELLDRQLVDVEGRMVGNVDDLRLRWPDEDGPPFVDAILAGPGALSRRIGGRLGHWIASVHARLQDSDLEGTASISFGVVRSIGSDIRLTVRLDQLGTQRFQEWVRDRIVAKIPGS
jgi:sporulation protein YlmC with PRC-barrel domain